METPQKVRRTVLLALALTINVLLIAIWATRPSLIYSEWMALGNRDDAPIRVFSLWTRGHVAPWTPLGFLSVFEPLDLVVAAALLFVLAVLVILLALTWAGQSLPFLAKVRTRITWPPSIKIGVSAAMIAVAIVGLELGWEVNGWETWRLGERHLKKLYSLRSDEAGFNRYMQGLRERIGSLESTKSSGPDQSRTTEAIEADRVAWLAQTKRELVFCEAKADVYARLVRKYERAVAHPRQTLEPDPPFPEPEPDAQHWLSRREYRRALEAFDEEIRRYPGLWDAHYHRAWILATCPDARIRDGKAAVESAIRACELTNWNRPHVLDTLAAAHAEAGDFKAAIELEKRALAKLGAGGSLRMNGLKRLALYQAGKPFHQER